MKYYAPHNHYTGALVQQPNNHVRTDWMVTYCPDAVVGQRIGINDTGFLDAPEAIPTGSVRALDCATCTLGIDYVGRP